MSLKFAVFSVVVSLVVCDEAEKKSDSVVSGADFVPQFHSFQFPPQPVLAAQHDLTALQQTHVLGSFHHRFHPTSVNPQFGVNAPPPLVLAPQTHIVPPQPTEVVQDQRALLQEPLVPPAPSQQVLRPPGFHQSPLIPPQPSATPQQTFKTLPPQRPTFSANDQSIKNAFPSNAPHTIKFSISSANYNPGQVRQQQQQQQQQQQFENSSSSVKIGQPKQLSQGRFSSTPQLQQSRATFTHSSNQFPQQQTNFQTFNSFNQFKKPEVSVNQQNVNFNVQSKPSFASPSQHPTNPPSQGNSLTENSASVGHGNFATASQPKFTQSVLTQQSLSQPVLTQSSIQPNFEFRQSPPQHQTVFNQNQFLQPNFAFSSVQSHQQNVNSLPPTSQTQFQSAERQQQKFSSQQNLEYSPTEAPRAGPTEVISGKQHPVSVAPTVPQSVSPFSQGKETNFQKFSGIQSQNAGITRNNAPQIEIAASSSPPTAETFTTVTSNYRKPKPIVKEITINLNDKGITGEEVPQLYIKEDRQKEFLEIKEQDQREQSKVKKEKSQEDVINEQIQKLLQSHNLEIIDKDNDSGTESQEAQLSQFSEQFKKKYNYSVQLLNGGSLLREVKQKKKILTTLPPLPDLPEHIKKQYEIKLVNREDLFKQFSVPGNHKLSNDSSNIFLANGQQLEIVKFSKDGIMDKIPLATKTNEPTTTTKPPKVLFEELTKGVIPPGADFELIKHKGDGQVEKVTDLNPAKKVTFVFLEEQPDGSVKVQGVKGNTNQETEQQESVDSLIEKIKDGSIKLPPSKQASLLTNEIPRISPVSDRTFVTFAPSTPTPRSINNFPSTSSPYHADKDSADQGPTTEFYSSPYAVDLDSTYTPAPFYETTPDQPTTFLPTVNYFRSSTRKTKSRSRATFLPTVPSVDSTLTPTFASKRIKPTTSKPSSIFKNFVPSRKVHKSLYSKTTAKYEELEYPDAEVLSHKPTEYSGQRLKVPFDVVAEESNIDAVRPLNEILRENGLREMAKYMDQSGLDSILNETGPYTIFIPTDRAFKTLEKQLGGEDKAEDKFRENPRLLSGLLLHHVVPGSFRLEDLQDEMTGVSLAGTQLRVNAYVSEEKNSAGIRTVTINGAEVSAEKKDISVPQGLAHAIDRVLFPLPVGDIVQTLRGDRERRFTKFLKALESSGLMDVLTGTKTYTVFAPTDKAFAVLTDSELDKLLTRREAARTIVLRHIVPGTLYSAGMNYYQVKESMESGQKITIKKELGKIKANSAQIVSANIPATNGVIHAVESLL